MSLVNITKKEIKELMTPSTIVPIVVIAILFASMGNIMGGFMEEAEEKPVIGVINEGDGKFADMAMYVLEENAEIVYNGTDMKVGIDEVTEKGGAAVLKFPENFSYNIENNMTGTINVVWIMRGVGIMDSVSSSVVEDLIHGINTYISHDLVEEKTGVDPSHIQNPTVKEETIMFKDREMQGISPTILGGMLASQSIMLPIVTMMLIMMAGGAIISSMGMEKEDKTLETLLTLPIKRGSIVTGKLIGAATVGLLMAVIYMLGYGYYMQSLQTAELNLADYGLSLSLLDYVLVGISLFFALVSGLALSLLLGTFAKNYKSAQTLLFPVTALAIIPMFVFMFTDINNLPLMLRGIMYAIPFSHPIIAMRSLMFGDYIIVILGILYTALFSMVMIGIVVWIFNSDRLITGRIGRKEGILDKLSR
ncbi:MAG: ABC transporter permease [Candidatus Saliniplasma sp.]